MSRTNAALSIAGSDSSAGAGLQADLKTFSALGVYGATVVAAVTAQNTLGVTAVHVIPGEIITAQLDAVFSDSLDRRCEDRNARERRGHRRHGLRYWALGAGHTDCDRPRDGVDNRQPPPGSGR